MAPLGAVEAVEDDEEEAATTGVGAAESLLVVPLGGFFFLNWNKKFSSSSSATALLSSGVPRIGLDRAGAGLDRAGAGLPAEPLAGVTGALGVFGVRGAGDVNILESSRRGVPTVKSSSKLCRPEDAVRRCSKAL